MNRSDVTDLPHDRTARLDVLLTGSVTATGGKVVSTCTLVRHGNRNIVIDPGMADSPDAILEPLASMGIHPHGVTDVILSHHHPDHTMYVGLFPRAAVHDFWAIYRGTTWEDSDAEGRELTSAVRLIRVPGHTTECIATLVGTPDGVAVCCHLWFDADGPIEDDTAEDAEQLHASRARVLAIADLIVPGHGAPFTPNDSTPR